jgi:hypothetical protein
MSKAMILFWPQTSAFLAVRIFWRKGPLDTANEWACFGGKIWIAFYLSRRANKLDKSRGHMSFATTSSFPTAISFRSQ